MDQVKIGELKNSLSRYLDHVREGGEVVVLDRTTPIARIVPFGRGGPMASAALDENAWERERVTALERVGVLKRGADAERVSPLPRRTRLPKGAPSLVSLVLRSRRESAR